LKLKPKGKKAKKKLLKLVKKGAKAKAKITVTLTDLAGNSTSEKVVVKLKK
jgi:C4-type Zn-finger protein